jgi:hypothetical protein
MSGVTIVIRTTAGWGRVKARVSFGEPGDVRLCRVFLWWLNQTYDQPLLRPSWAESSRRRYLFRHCAFV